MRAQKPKEDHMLEKRLKRGREMEKKLDQKTRCSLQCCLALVGLIPKLLFKWCGLHFCSPCCPCLCPLHLFIKMGHVMRKAPVIVGWSKVCFLNEWETEEGLNALPHSPSPRCKSPRMPPEEGLLHPLLSHLLLKRA